MFISDKTVEKNTKQNGVIINLQVKIFMCIVMKMASAPEGTALSLDN